jgi:indolepyruvate decarboxylase
MLAARTSEESLVARHRATTCGELDRALEMADQAKTGVYIEVVTDPYVASPLALKLHESLQTLYKS